MEPHECLSPFFIHLIFQPYGEALLDTCGAHDLPAATFSKRLIRPTVSYRRSASFFIRIFCVQYDREYDQEWLTARKLLVVRLNRNP